MTKKNQILLNMILENKTIEDICKELNLTKKQLKSRIESIKKDGYRVNRVYSKIGKDKLCIDYDSESLKTKIIKTSDVSKRIKLGVISDTHIGSTLTDMDDIKRFYEYFKKEDASFILHCGDFVDGENVVSKDILEQAYTSILDYPKDDTMRTFIIFGNHDEDFVQKTGIDLAAALKYYRDDLIPLGYDTANIEFINTMIKLSHKINVTDNINSQIHIAGHAHKFSYTDKQNTLKIVAPAVRGVSNINNYPGALILELFFSKDEIELLKLKQLMAINNSSIQEIGNIEHQFIKRKK